MKKSYLVKLSCLKKKTKFKRHYSRLSFYGLPETIGVSPINDALEMIHNGCQVCKFGGSEVS
jgi:hypothetical protein